jgi:BirA family biotin operon repressor/biotin-[acetyl-CoA-carboxylase] ligase
MHRRTVSIEIFDEISSTNDSILAAGAADLPEGTTHIALVQTAGRGRAQHRWWSPRGAGLSMSTLLRPTLPRDRWAGLALVAGAATHRALSRSGVRGLELEWPNDLVAGRRKLGGILCEVRATGSKAWVALGIGVNLDLERPESRRSMPAQLQDIVTCATAEGPIDSADPETIGRRILEELWPVYDEFLTGSPVASLVGELLSHRGRPVHVALPDGAEFEGTVEGLGARGELLVTPADGRVRAVIAGDVHYLDRPAS